MNPGHLKADWKPYIPSILGVSGAVFFFVFPMIAAFLVVCALIAVSLIYAAVVFHMRKIMRQRVRYDGMATDGNYEPTFKNVSVYIMKRGKDYTEKDL